MGRNAAYKTLQLTQAPDVRKEQPVAPLVEVLEDSLKFTPQSSTTTEPEAEEDESVKPVEESVKKVVIQRGDRLTNIALAHYGHKLFWVYIYQHNKSLIDDPNNVPIGTELILPPAQQYGINAKSRASLEAAATLQTEILTRK